MAHERHQRGRYWLLPLLMLRFAGLSRCGVAGERPNGKGGVVAWPVTVGSVHPDHEALPWTEVATFAELERGCRQSGGGKFRITANLKFPRHITISGDATTTQVTISGRIPPPATADGKHTFVLHGQNRTNFFSVRNNASLLVEDLEFAHGRSVLGGAVSLLRGSSGAFARVRFDRCHAGVDGGAIRAKDSALAVAAATFADCSAHFYGGGVSLVSSPAARLGDVAFERNAARLAGGAVHVAKATPSSVDDSSNRRPFNTALTLENASFHSCAAQYEGGSLFIGDSNSVDFDGATFTGSRAKYGGAIYTEGSKTVASLHGGTFSNCSAELGGELKRSSGKFTCRGCPRGFAADSCRSIECDGCSGSCLVDCACTACGEACPESEPTDVSLAASQQRSFAPAEALEDIVSHYKPHDEIVQKFAKSIKKAAHHQDSACVASMEAFAAKCKETKDCTSLEYLAAARCSKRKKKPSSKVKQALSELTDLKSGWLEISDPEDPKVIRALEQSLSEVNCGFTANSSKGFTCDKIVDVLEDTINRNCSKRQSKRPEPPKPPPKPKKGQLPLPPPKQLWTTIEDLSKPLQSLRLVEDLPVRSQFYDTYPVPIMSSKDKLNKTCERFDHKWRFCPGANSTQHLFYQCDIRRFVAAVDCGFVDVGPLGFSKAAKEKKQQLVDDARSKARKDHKSKDNVQAAVEAATKKVMSKLRTEVKYPGLVHTWNETFPVHGVTTDNQVCSRSWDSVSN
jgi:predicted outer membrane repeat protein